MPAIEVISQLRADEPDFDISDDRNLKALVAFEDRHFWQRARNDVIVDRLSVLGVKAGDRVLELGCGPGSVAMAMQRAGLDVTGVDGHFSLLAIAHRREPRLRLWQHDLRRGIDALPERDFDAVGLFDVIEHLDDPIAALVDALACARPGGWLVGTVPALMALWSTIDEDVGHKTRYDQATLNELLRVVPGAEVVEVAPFFRTLVPLLWVQRKFVGRGHGVRNTVRNWSVPPRPLNAALAALVRAEHRAGAALNWLDIPGTSLWFALRRAR